MMRMCEPLLALIRLDWAGLERLTIILIAPPPAVAYNHHRLRVATVRGAAEIAAPCSTSLSAL